MRINEQPWTCEKCGARVAPGFARCDSSGCGFIRPEFKAYERVIVSRPMQCVFSGAATDVCIPNGDAIWAPYFLDFVDGGWLGADLSYTKAFYDTHPTMRPKDGG